MFSLFPNSFGQDKSASDLFFCHQDTIFPDCRPIEQRMLEDSPFTATTSTLVLSSIMRTPSNRWTQEKHMPGLFPSEITVASNTKKDPHEQRIRGAHREGEGKSDVERAVLMREMGSPSEMRCNGRSECVHRWTHKSQPSSSDPRTREDFPRSWIVCRKVGNLWSGALHPVSSSWPEQGEWWREAEGSS